MATSKETSFDPQGATHQPPAGDYGDRNLGKRGAAVVRLALVVPGLAAAAVVGLSMLVSIPSHTVGAGNAEVQRGCTDCRTPEYLFGEPDTARTWSAAAIAPAPGRKTAPK